MATNSQTRPERHRLDDTPLNPAYVRMSLSTLPTERRDVVARKALVRRIRNEFEEMPGMSLTLIQATKLFGIRPDVCSRVFLRFIEDGVLRLTSDGRYRSC